MLMTADSDPLLVTWRFGIGRVTAFTSDLSGRWGREWVAWQEFPRWSSQLARFTMRQLLDGAARAEFKTEQSSVRVLADLKSPAGKFLNQLKLKARVAAPDGTTQEQALRQSAPGRYTGQFDPQRRGVHLVTLYTEGEAAGTADAVGTFAYIAPYPKEYRALTPNLSLLSRLAEATGGEMVDSGDLEEGVKRLYAPKAGTALRARQTWRVLALLALLVFLTDLVLRMGASRLPTPQPA
jgi:hypothetical protein